MKITVFLSDEQDLTPPENMELLIKQCALAVLEEENIKDNAEVSVTLVDDNKIKELNNLHRGIDKVTDVLSFPMGDKEGFEVDYDNDSIILGDIVISLQRALAQSKEYQHSYRREVAFLITHSLFHLLGYDHVNSKEEEAVMFSKQEKVLDKLGITRGDTD